jgi:RimJ/RimL family protein N-acetyltransferase
MDLEIVAAEDGQALALLHHSIGWFPQPDVNAAAHWIRHMNSDKAIGRKLVVDGELVGGGQLTVQKYPHAVELGAWVMQGVQGRGYGRAVTRMLTELALGPLGYHRVFAKTFSNNLRMLRGLERAGMLREGVLRDVGFKDGQYYDEIYYGRLVTDAAVQPPAT